MEEKLIIKKILHGNTSEFSYFVDTYQDMAITIAYRICHNMQDAEDIVQDAFMKSFRNLHTFKVGSKFSTWFYRIVYNTALSHIKSTFYTNEHVDYAEVNTFNDEWDVIKKMDEEQRKDIINNALDRLPKDYALILTLFYLEENSIKDVIKITGLTEANIKVRLHRGRKLLASILQSQINNGKFQT